MRMSHISQIIKANKPTVTFEFFPPRTPEVSGKLFETIKTLEAYDPSFVSVTYGAGGTTRQTTHELVKRICEETKIPPIPHLTCIGHSKEEISEILDKYSDLGVHTILALRGDPPVNNPDYDRSQDDFQYAGDLVSFIKNFESAKTPRGTFGIGVAGFPEGHHHTPDRLQEMAYMKQKVEQGADYICTQLFFDNNAFFDYKDRCHLEGINIPIIAGVMPITTLKGMKRMAELSAGTNFTAKLLRRVYRYQDSPQDLKKAGIDFAIEQCQELIDRGVDGIHLYTLNQSTATVEILKQLKINR